MATCNSTPNACASAQRDDLRTIVETDRRRGSIGLHVASDVTRTARTMTSVWLDPDRAERLAQEILAAVRAYRDDQAVVAWTEPQGGCHHG